MREGGEANGHDNTDGVQVTNQVFEKYKAKLCATGNEQIAGIHFDERDLYAPVLASATSA